MQLTPDTFACPAHGVDLTPQVVEALEELPPPVAYGDRTFRVPVACPGDGPAAAHALMCSGRYRR